MASGSVPPLTVLTRVLVSVPWAITTVRHSDLLPIAKNLGHGLNDGSIDDRLWILVIVPFV